MTTQIQVTYKPATQIRAAFEKVGFNIHPECPAIRFLGG